MLLRREMDGIRGQIEQRPGPVGNSVLTPPIQAGCLGETDGSQEKCMIRISLQVFRHILYFFK